MCLHLEKEGFTHAWLEDGTEIGFVPEKIEPLRFHDSTRGGHDVVAVEPGSHNPISMETHHEDASTHSQVRAASGRSSVLHPSVCSSRIPLVPEEGAPSISII